MNLKETTLSENYVFKGKIINVRNDEISLPNGKTAFREVVEHSGGVTILPVDEQGNVYFVRQFRYPYMDEILEIPAGKLEKGEDIESCGRRELSEEIGATCEEFDFLGEIYPSPGYTSEVIYVCLGKKLSFSSQHLDEDEFLNVEKFSLEECLEMIRTNKIKDAKTIFAINFYYTFIMKK